MREWVVAIFVLLASSIMLIGAVGLVRLPDLLTRMQAATKPIMLGTGLIAIAAAVQFAELLVTLRALLIAVFFFVTAPVAAHAIARAAYLSGVPLYSRFLRDDWSPPEREGSD